MDQGPESKGYYFVTAKRKPIGNNDKGIIKNFLDGTQELRKYDHELISRMTSISKAFICNRKQLFH